MTEFKTTPTFADAMGSMPGTAVPAALQPTFVGVTGFPSSRVTGQLQRTETTAELPKRESVAIIGTAPSSRMLAPFNDPTWEIWACSPGNMNTLPRVDAWFEIHGNLFWPEHESYGRPYIEWLAKQTFPVYMQDQSYFPHALTFPMQELVEEFGGDFFSSSFAWMMAFAIRKGFKHVALFGVDMASRDEYILQRPGFYYFRREAERRGVKVSAPRESDIMQSPGLYGYSEVTPFGRKLHAREIELKQRIAQMEQVEKTKAQAALEQVSQNILYLKGALEDVDYMKSIHIRLGQS